MDMHDIGLCCDCGQRRLFSRAYSGGSPVGQSSHPWPEWIIQLKGITDPWERETIVLKCDPCGRKTRHARISQLDWDLERRLSGDPLSH